MLGMEPSQPPTDPSSPWDDEERELPLITTCSNISRGEYEQRLPKERGRFYFDVDLRLTETYCNVPSYLGKCKASSQTQAAALLHPVRRHFE